jgi:hypothetical protein
MTTALNKFETERPGKKNGSPPTAATHRYSILLFTRLFSASLACKRFLHTLFLAGLQVKGVALNLLDDVFLLHLALKTSQRIFEGFALLESDFRQPNYTPKLVPLDPVVIARFGKQVKGECRCSSENWGCFSFQTPGSIICLH